MSYPFTAWSDAYEKDTLRLRPCRGWIGPRCVLGCTLDEIWRANLTPRAIAERRLSEIDSVDHINFRKCWRGAAFRRLENKLLKESLKESGLSRSFRCKVLARVFRVPLRPPVKILNEARRFAREEIRREERRKFENDISTRPLKLEAVSAETIKFRDTNHWKWLVDEVNILAEGKVLSVDVPSDVTAKSMANLVRGVLMQRKETGQYRWSVKRSNDDRRLFIQKIGKHEPSIFEVAANAS